MRPRDGTARRRSATWWGWSVALSAAALVVGCGGDDEPAASTPRRVPVAEAPTGAELAVVEGALVARADSARLCSGLAESYPPMCVEPAVAVPGLDTSLIAGTQTNGDAPLDQRVVWTDRQIALTGRADDGALTLAAKPLAGSGSAVLVRAMTAPVCAAETDPPDPGCAPRMLEGATIELRRADGQPIIEATTDAIGVAVFVMPAGTYSVAGLEMSEPTRAPDPQAVTVESGTSEVLLVYDTGIR